MREQKKRMHFLAACLASMAMMANAQQAQPVPVATMNGAPQPAVLAPHDPCFYMGGDCAQCLTIPECTFCTPTVKTTGQCVLKSNSAVCASEYYAFPADTCCMYKFAFNERDEKRSFVYSLMMLRFCKIKLKLGS